mgnify:CR=1 FL=1
MNQTALFDRLPLTAIRPQNSPLANAEELGQNGQPMVFDCPDIWQHDAPMLDTIRREYGHLRCRDLAGTYGWVLRYEDREVFDALNIDTLGEFIELWQDDAQREMPYFRHLSIFRNLPQLARYLVPPAQFRPNWVTHPMFDRIGGPELFFGQAGTGFGNVHIDHVGVHVGFYQFSGEKQFILFPPEDAPCLYTYPGQEFPWQVRNSRITGPSINDLERWPLLKLTRPRTLVLKAGQAMFLPSNWWHTTLNLTDSVSYSIRIVNRSNAATTARELLAGLPRLVTRRLAR